MILGLTRRKILVSLTPVFTKLRSRTRPSFRLPGRGVF